MTRPLQTALEVEAICVRFGRPVLDGLSLAAAHGQVTAVLGPNGAGKTTLLRCCTGLITPDSGAISVLGHRPGAPAIAARVGLMPQSTGAWSGIKAGRAAALPRRPCTGNPHDVAALHRAL